VRWSWSLLLAGLGTIAVLAGGGHAAASIPDAWQPRSKFAIQLEQLPGLADGGTKATYQLLDPEGHALGGSFELTPVNPFTWVAVPAPGAYTLESKLEDGAGNVLRQASATLRFDDAVPPPPSPRAPERWLPGDKPAILAFDPPSGPIPLSGIAGYEVSLDRGNVRLESTGDPLSLGFLPEGITSAQVVTLSGSGVRSEARTVALAVDATPPAVSLQGLPVGWSDGPVRVAAVASDSLSGMEAAGVSGPATTLAVDGDAPITAPGATASTWVGGSGVHSVRFYGRDAVGNVGDGGPGSPPPQSALVRIDEVPPQVDFAAAQDPTDPERIEAFVDDRLSGPSPDRGSIAVRPAGTRGRFEPLPTRVERGRLVARWDSDDYPSGKYELTATGFDAAGNSTLGTGRAHGGPMVLLNPLKAQASLTAKLTGTRLSGLLRRAAGGPVAGQTIAIGETFAIGADRRQRTSYVRTGADGSFSLRLRPGPSREVAARFGGTHLLTRATAPGFHLTAATAIRFHASATSAAVGGKPVVFSGRVGTRGARGSAGGLPVELQFRYPGAGWSDFRTVETDGHGRFRYAYRFSDDDSRGVRFRFRAYVKGREGWPYGPGSSRPVSVRGR